MAVPVTAVMLVVPAQLKLLKDRRSMRVLLLAPIWKSLLPVDARMLTPLNCVPPSVRVTSWAICTNSLFRLARSASVLVPLADCTASSRMRWKISPVRPSAPSATWASEIASLELRSATFMPRTWVFMRSEMARPAASSRAVLTRRPDDKRLIEVARSPSLALRLRWAVIETRLVLMLDM